MGVDDSTPEWWQQFEQATAHLESRESTVTFDDDLIPEAPDVVKNEEQDEIDRLIDGIDILDAYRRWCGKMEPKVGRRTESIMISCPMHDPDKDPSAWINTEKQLYECGTCHQGGDKYTIAARRFGFDYNNYQTTENFPRLKRMMAEDLGYVVKTSLGGQVYLEKVVVEEEEPEPVDEATNVVKFPTLADEYEVEEENAPQINWQDIVPGDTFLRSYMEAVEHDDIAPEFHLFLALVCIGFASGTNQLLDDAIAVKPNLYIVLYGDTGSGKSRSTHPFKSVLKEALPYDEDLFSASTGCRIQPVPNSAEALLKSFTREVQDPSNMQVVDRPQVRGLVLVDEFASFVARASRHGSTMKQTIMEMYDVINGDVTSSSLSGGLIKAPNPFVQMVTTSQPQAIHEFMRKTDLFSGFLNRWVFVKGVPRRERIAYGKTPYDMDDAIKRLKDLHQWCDTPRDMVLEGLALTRWETFFYNEMLPAQRIVDSPMMSRADLILKKLILLFTINAKEDNPTVETVEQAIALFKYLMQTWTNFATDLNYSELEECRRTLLEALEGRPEGIKARDLRRYTTQYDTKTTIEALKLMITLGEVEEEIVKPKRGPSTKRYKHVGK